MGRMTAPAPRDDNAAIARPCQIMQAAALLAHTPAPTDKQIDDAVLSGSYGCPSSMTSTLHNRAIYGQANQ
jgi:hypothetical protein